MIFWIFLVTIVIIRPYNSSQLTYNDTAPKKLFNLNLRDQSQWSYNPPSTDGGSQSPFKYPFEYAYRNRYSSGWNRQISKKDLEILNMSGTQLRIFKGGAREIHWHVAPEWGYVIWGDARITAVDQNGHGYVEDVTAGDVFFFAGSVTHGVQGMGNDGALFHTVFGTPMLSSAIIYGVTDWMTNVPPEVLAKNFGEPASTFSKLPKQPINVFACPLPQSLALDKAAVSKGTGFTPEPIVFVASSMIPTVSRCGGHVKIIDKKNFPATNFAAVIVTLKPGAMRELHFHLNVVEWQYYVEGKARLSIFNGSNNSRTMDMQAGDVGFVPESLGHYVENTGNVDVVYLEVFPTPYYEAITLAEWLAHTPGNIVSGTLGTGSKFRNSISKTRAEIRPL